MGNRAFKDEIYAQFARIAKSIASAPRLEILDILAQGERSVEHIAEETSLTVANTSRHLQELRHAHLVTTRKEGLRVYYRLSDPSIYQLLQSIREIAERQLAEVDRVVATYLSARNGMEPVSMQELRERLRDPGLLILDVRPSVEYEQGHIMGARSIPIDELESRLGEIRPDQEIIAYCRGPYCVFADEAIELLQARGFQARRLELGYPDWLLQQFPVEN